MPYVQRDAEGNVRSLYANEQDFASEFLPDDDAAVVAFLNPRINSVTPRQARLALLSAGLLPAVESAVKAAGGATQITWEYATEINRNDALITTLGSALGLTDAAIDLLFKQAATIK